jgi:polyhydroxyalkanoate synthesis regulator phasin
MADEQKRKDTGEGIRDGVRAIVGVAGALKEAIEDTFQELLDRGELSPERAREAARSTVQRAQDTVEGMRDRFDFVPRKEFDALRQEVAELRRLLEQHRIAPSSDPAGGEPEKPRFTVDDA